jgi:hypothetical protein
MLNAFLTEGAWYTIVSFTIMNKFLATIYCSHRFVNRYLCLERHNSSIYLHVIIILVVDMPTQSGMMPS